MKKALSWNSNRITCSVWVLTFLSTFTFGQVDKKRIKEQAEVTAAALMQSDYETLLNHTYPVIIDMIGGREEMISVIENGRAEMEQQGISFESVTIGDPTETVEAGEEIHCLISQTLFLKVPKGRMKSESYLLAISQDNGAHWFFIDTVNLTMENIKDIIPNYNLSLVLPPRKQPLFIPD